MSSGGAVRELPRVDEQRLPGAAKLSSSSMARRHGRFAQRQQAHVAKRAPKKKVGLEEGNIFNDAGRTEALRYQKQVDDLKKEQQALLAKLNDSGYDPGIHYTTPPEEITQYQIASAKLDQLKFAQMDKDAIEQREKDLQKQRIAKINLQAAQSYQRIAGQEQEPLLPFYYSKEQRQSARRAYKRVKSHLFGRYGLFQNLPFNIDRFHELRIQQLKTISEVIPQELIQLEIQRRVAISHSSNAELRFIPMEDNPMLKFNPKVRLLRRLSDDPRHDMRKSMFLKTKHNPYIEFNRSMVPVLTRIFRETTILPTQQPVKKLVQSFKVQFPTTKRYFKEVLRLSPMYLRRYRLLHSKYRGIRNLARRFHIFTPHSTDTFDSVKTTPVYFPNANVASTAATTQLDTATLATESIPPQEQLTTAQQAALLWLDELPYQLDVNLLLTGHSDAPSLTPSSKPPSIAQHTPSPSSALPSFLQTKIYLVPRKPRSSHVLTTSTSQRLPTTSTSPHTNPKRLKLNKTRQHRHTARIHPIRSPYELAVNPTEPIPPEQLIITPISKLDGELPMAHRNFLPFPPSFLALPEALPPAILAVSEAVTAAAAASEEAITTKFSSAWAALSSEAPEKGIPDS